MVKGNILHNEFFFLQISFHSLANKLAKWTVNFVDLKLLYMKLLDRSLQVDYYTG